MNGRLKVKSTLETRLSWYVKPGPTSNGVWRTLSIQGEQPFFVAARGWDVQTGRLGADHAKDERAAAFRRLLRGCASRSRDGEERDGDDRGEG